ncbi:AAA family ATPase [Pseudomonas plecoglossicida]|uniref:AAA family ATPase n=1 Tax=Pseudomonas plecoglossicida TaxID=70775 RepID=UPI003D230AD3
MNDEVKLCSGLGQYHTDRSTEKRKGKALLVVTWSQIVKMVKEPPSELKAHAQWLIPSTLLSRVFAEQETNGLFWLLWFDLDKEPPALEAVLEALTIVGVADFCLYSSRSATAEVHKWRGIIRLKEGLSGEDWMLAQECLNDTLADAGIEPDRVSQRCGQLCYLPNAGEYYATHVQDSGVGFDALGAYATAMAQKRAQLLEQAKVVQERRALCEQRREALQASDAPDTIGAFNQCFDVADVLLGADYVQRGNTFRHPESASGSFSASVKDGRVHSLSSSDPLHTSGSEKAGGERGAHDAFSAFTVLYHEGNLDAALKDAGDQWLAIGDESWNAVKQREWAQKQPKVDLPAFVLVPLSEDEIRKARLSPRVILDGLLYADVRTRIAAGGIGKTTLALFEAVTLALGRELWGRTPERPVRTLLVSREDARETLAARLCAIMAFMQLGGDERTQVLRNVMVLDLSGESFRLSAIERDVVVPHRENLDRLLDACREWKPDWIIFDPLVSFGVGESRVNDAEQGLIEAFRVLRNGLDCCVEGIHHTGKANARDKTADQYTGRGGSALADGCRMVVVINPLDAGEWLKATGSPLHDTEQGLVMALPKLSYNPRQEPVFIRRSGYSFEHVVPVIQTPVERTESNNRKVLDFITSEYVAGRKYSKDDLDTCTDKLDLTRTQIRAACTALKVSARVIYNSTPGKTGAHFSPVTSAENGGGG